MGWYLFFLTLLGQLLVSFLSLGLSRWFSVNLSEYPFAEPLIYVMMFLPVLLFLRKELRGILFSATNDKCRGRHLFLLPLFFISAVVLISSLPLPEPAEWYVVKMGEMVHPSKIVFTILTVSVLAPLLEELIFRGAVEREFLKSYSPPVAILLSALMFGAIHQNLWQMVPAFLYGIIFGWLYYKFRNIWITIGLHSLNNTLSVVLAYAMRDDVGRALLPFREVVGNDLIFWPIIIVAIIIFVFSIYIIDRKLGDKIL